MPDKLPPPLPSPTSLPETTSRLSEIKALLRQSVGKLPARLVFILISGIVLALLVGAMMKLVHHERERFEWLPLRLAVNTAEPALDMNSFQGAWSASTDRANMSLQFQATTFEWIIVMRDEARAYYYARGNYRVEGNVLILSQRPDLGRPFDRGAPFRTYIPFTMKNFNSYAKMTGGGMEWLVPVTEQKVFNPRQQNIFDRERDATLIWKKVDARAPRS